jgi:hypothetical protein
MSSTKLEEILDAHVADALELHWEIRTLSGPVDEIEQDVKYHLDVWLKNVGELRFEQIELRLSTATSDAFGDHVQFHEGPGMTSEVPLVLLEFDALPGNQETPRRTAYFLAKTHIRSGDLEVGIFYSHIAARVLPTGRQYKRRGFPT